MRVSVQRETRRVVAQHRGHRFYVHTVLQCHGREGVAQVVKAYCGAISALPGGRFFSYSGAIFERSKNLSIDYNGSKYARFTPKNTAVLKSLF